MAQDFQPSGSPLKWALAAVLAAAATCVVVAAFRTTFAQAQQPGASEPQPAKRNIVAVAGQISRDSNGIYVIDTDNGTMAVYEWVSDRIAGRKLKLVAARNIAFDLQLDDYNNAEPLPSEVKKLVEQHRRLNNAATQPG